jgi:hypothetical protein
MALAGSAALVLFGDQRDARIDIPMDRAIIPGKLQGTGRFMMVLLRISISRLANPVYARC